MGSVKTNIGHLEAAAGVAGLIKVALALHHREIPPHLHFDEPSPLVPWHELPITVPTERQPWGSDSKPNVAGLSSFGFSGTNAHVVLEEAPPPASVTAREPRTDMLVLSARSPEALRALADDFGSFLGSADGVAFHDICFTAAVRRTHHPHRLAVVADSTDDARERLRAFVAGVPDPAALASSVVPPEARRLIFVYSGQGGQWPRMGAQLLEQEPSFAAAVEECAQLVERHAGWSVLDALRADARDSRFGDTEIAQPTLLALQVGLTELWRSWGVVPDAVVGHSVGEVAAAYAAGALGLEDAVRIVVARGRAMQPVKGRGRMAALGLAADLVEELLEPYRGRVSIAGENGPQTTIVSGDTDAVEDVLAAAAEHGIFHRALPGTYAFHSEQMASVAPILEAELAALDVHTPRIPIFSTVTGGPAGADDFGGPHWARQVTERVRFATALRAAGGTAHDTAVEIGPGAVLGASIAQTLGRDSGEATVLASLRTGDDDARAAVLEAAAALHVRGFRVDHARRYAEKGRVVALPSYPWQRRRYWLPAVDGNALLSRSDGSSGATPSTGYALVKRRFDAARPGGERYFEADVDLEALPYLRDYCVAGTPVLPTSAIVELVLAASRSSDGPSHVRELVVHERPLLGAQTSTLQLHVGPGGPEGRRFELFLVGGDDSAQALATGIVTAGAPDGNGAVEPSAVGGERIDVDSIYGASPPLEIGQAFRAFERLERDGQTAVGTVSLPESAEATGEAYVAHPVLLEAAFHALAVAAGRPQFVASAVRSLTVHRHLRGRLRVWAHAAAADGDAVEGTFSVVDEAGVLVARAEGIRLEAVDTGLLRDALGKRLDGLFYDLSWTPVGGPPPTPAAPPPGTWIVLADDDVGPILGSLLEDHSQRCILVERQSALDPAAVQAVLEQAAAPDGPPLRGVVHLWGVDRELEVLGPEELDRVVAAETETLLHLVQGLARADGDRPRVWIGTRGAQPVAADQEFLAPQHAPLWGLGRVIALEHPEIWGGLVDLDPAASKADAQTLLNELFASTDEDQVAYRSGARHGLRLVGVDPPPATELELRSDASYLVTGGRGVLGLLVAGWLVEHGARHLILTGRQPVPPRAEWRDLPEDDPAQPFVTAALRLEERGATVHTISADVADADAMAAALDSPDAAWPPIKGVVHAAGVFEPHALHEMSAVDLRRVLRPKVRGTAVLDALTRRLELDFFLLFSSAAAVWGSALAGHYVAANHFEDLVAHARRRDGLPALAVNWGWWAGSDMVPPEAQAYFAAIGLEVISEQLGFAALERLLASDATQRTVAPVDWRRFKPVFEAKRRRPLLALIEVPQQDEPAGTASAEGLVLLDRVRRTPAAARHGVAVEFLQEQVGRILGRDAANRLDPGLGFFEAGMDSITAVELKTRLETTLGIVLPATAAFEYPNIETLAAYLVDDVFRFDDEPEDADSNLEAMSEEELLTLLAREVEPERAE